MTIGEAFQEASDNGGYISILYGYDLEDARSTLISDLLEGDDSVEGDEGVSDWNWKITPYEYRGDNGEVVICQRLSASSVDRPGAEITDRLVFDVAAAKKIGLLSDDD